MDAQAIITVSAAVVALTQLIKWLGLPKTWGAVTVLGLSALGVLLWVYTQNAFVRQNTFALFSGWISVATSAAGIYGFTRAGSDAVVATRTPPPTPAAPVPFVPPAAQP